MYLLTVRIRLFPANHASAWHQHLLDHFFHNAEDRMALYHGMSARGVRNKYLKDLWIQWRGVLAAYDEGLVKGDAVMAAAVWRNVFKADPAVDIKAVAEIVSWMRREVRRLGEARDEEVSAGWEFKGNPGEESPAVALQSERMKLKE
jgi:cytochrome b pre-mRNA-processing protein 3